MKSPERGWLVAYGRELVLAVAGYAVVLVVSLLAIDRLSGPARVVVSLLPALPFAACGVVVLRMLRRVDERERSLMYRAVGFAFFGTAVATIAYGFLENAGAPRLSMFTVWPLMAAFWIVGRFVAPRLP